MIIGATVSSGERGRKEEKQTENQDQSPESSINVQNTQKRDPRNASTAEIGRKKKRVMIIEESFFCCEICVFPSRTRK